MKNLNFKGAGLVLLATVVLAACGGRNDGPQVGAGVVVPPDIGTNASAVLNYTNQLIASDENSDPVDIDGITLAVDDTDATPIVTF
jgi:hypothetical protein